MPEIELPIEQVKKDLIASINRFCKIAIHNIVFVVDNNIGPYNIQITIPKAFFLCLTNVGEADHEEHEYECA